MVSAQLVDHGTRLSIRGTGFAVVFATVTLPEFEGELLTATVPETGSGGLVIITASILSAAAC